MTYTVKGNGDGVTVTYAIDESNGNATITRYSPRTGEWVQRFGTDQPKAIKCFHAFITVCDCESDLEDLAYLIETGELYK